LQAFSSAQTPRNIWLIATKKRFLHELYELGTVPSETG